MQLRRAEVEEYVAVGELTVAAYVQFMLGPDDPYLDRLRDSASRAAEAELWSEATDSVPRTGE